jgi:hypothetical protein
MSATSNLEDEVTREITGAVLLTMNFKTTRMKIGIYTSAASVFSEQGDYLNGEGSGCSENTGDHKWRVRGHDILSDGSIIAAGGEMRLATRTYSAIEHTDNVSCWPICVRPNIISLLLELPFSGSGLKSLW